MSFVTCGGGLAKLCRWCRERPGIEFYAQVYCSRECFNADDPKLKKVPK